MKTIRSLMSIAGLSLAILVLGASGAKAQAVGTTHFAGTLTLPLETHWGPMALPAGHYTVQFGTQTNGARLVEIRGTAKNSPQGVILAGPLGDASGKANVVVCLREGNTLIVRSLEMPAIGKSIKFSLQHGTELMAKNGKHNGYIQLAEAPMLVQRIPVTLNAK